MSNVPVQVIVAAFNDPNGASDALRKLKEAKRERLIVIEDAAVITKDANGKIKIKETADMRGGKGAAVGAVVGGVIGLIAGPVGWAVLGGSAIGGLTAKLRDGGIRDSRLRTLGEGLTPNSSALVAIIDHIWVAQVERELAEQGAQVLTESLRDDIAEQLKAGNQVTYTVVATGDAVVAARAAGTSDNVEVSAILATPEGVYALSEPETEDGQAIADNGAAVGQAEATPVAGDGAVSSTPATATSEAVPTGG